MMPIRGMRDGAGFIEYEGDCEDYEECEEYTEDSIGTPPAIR